MHAPFVAGVGGILSADIAVPEHDRERRFHARVLTTGTEPLWQDDLMNNHGIPIIGLGARTEELAHLPLQWMPHIQVADVGASVNRAIALGGSALMQDESGKNQWAVLLDPNGAAFGIIPVVPAEALPPVTDESARVGHIAWLDLTVADATATRDFYREVIGWTARDVAMEDAGTPYADYCMVRHDGGVAAGICHARGPNLGLPPVWMLYLPVGDLASSLERVREEGGTVVKALHGADGHLAHAVIMDPAGVALALTQG